MQFCTFFHDSFDAIGGGNRDRTCDLLNANQMLSQLSYAPKKCRESRWKENDGQLFFEKKLGLLSREAKIENFLKRKLWCGIQGGDLTNVFLVAS